jgi:hypothetical protein
LKCYKFDDTPSKFPSFELKGRCHKIFCSRFFHESSSPKPLKITLGHFKFFRKFAEIFASQSAPPVSTTPVANFATSSAGVVNTGGKFVTGVNDTGGKFVTNVNSAGGKLPPVSTTPEANLPPVSTTHVANNGNNIRLLTT